MAAERTLVKLEGIRKRYGKFSLDIPDFTIREDEFLVIIGPSGSGKSTLLKIIGGFVEPERGQVLVKGHPIATQVGRERLIRTVFQDLALFPHMSVLKQLQLAASFSPGGPSKPKSRDELVQQWMERLKLTAQQHSKPSELSGGERQRLALGRAMIAEPKLLLLDEPMTALDHGLRYELWRHIDSIAEATNTAFVVITHDPDIALSRGERIAVIESGRCIQTGAPSELYKRPGSSSVAHLLGSANIVRWHDRRLVIRPELIKIAPSPIPDMHFNGEATLIHSAYFGSVIEHTMIWKEERLLVRQMADNETPLFLNKPVFFGWDVEDVNFLN